MKLLFPLFFAFCSTNAFAAGPAVKLIEEKVECRAARVVDGQNLAISQWHTKTFEIQISPANTRNCSSEFHGRCEFVPPQEIVDLLNQSYRLIESQSKSLAGYINGDLPVTGGVFFRGLPANSTAKVFFSFGSRSPNEAVDWNAVVAAGGFKLSFALGAYKDDCPLWK